MKHSTLVILNPHAGRGLAGQLANQIHTALKAVNLPFDLVETQGPGHAIELARTGRQQGYSTVVAAGGDGTVSEVINGLAQAAADDEPVGKLGLLSVGSANDFADLLGVPRDLHKAAQTLQASRLRQVDLGNTLIQNEAGSTPATVQRYFGNNVGIGFEAWVTLESYKIRWLRGAPLYTFAALRALRTCPKPYVDATWETQNGVIHRQAQRSLMISVGNSRRTGGGFYLNPEAVHDDGLLDVGIAADVSRWRILQLLPKALKGQHVSDPAWTPIRCHRLTVDLAEPLPVHTDGEVVTTTARYVEINLQPGRLAVIV